LNEWREAREWSEAGWSYARLAEENREINEEAWVYGIIKRIHDRDLRSKKQKWVWRVSTSNVERERATKKYEISWA